MKYLRVAKLFIKSGHILEKTHKKSLLSGYILRISQIDFKL